MKIIPLGIAGFIPVANRETSCVLAVVDDSGILLDCGTGVKRLMTADIAAEIRHIKSLHVFLSHYHMDHIAGLPWLLRATDKPLHFYFPTSPLVDSNGLSNAHTILNSPFFSLPLQNWPNFGSMTALTGSVSIGNDIQVNVTRQNHPGGSVGYRIRNFAYTTDVQLIPEMKTFIDKCDLLLADTMYDLADFEGLQLAGKGTDHGYSTGNAEVARMSGIQRLGLIHLNPLYDAQRLENLVSETRSVFEKAFIPQEGHLYEV